MYFFDKVQSDGDIEFIAQMVIKGDIHPAKEIRIEAEETLVPLQLPSNSNLNFNGESIRVVMALVSYQLYP